MDIKKEKQIREAYAKLTRKLIERNQSISTMESATSGLIASLITDQEGASAVFRGAFITYSNEAKIRNGVPASIIQEYGVYSTETATAMAEACRSFYGADIGIGITGTFGNVDPSNADSVPGEIYYAISNETETKSFKGIISPSNLRFESKMEAAELILEELNRNI